MSGQNDSNDGSKTPSTDPNQLPQLPESHPGYVPPIPSTEEIRSDFQVINRWFDAFDRADAAMRVETRNIQEYNEQLRMNSVTADMAEMNLPADGEKK